MAVFAACPFIVEVRRQVVPRASFRAVRQVQLWQVLLCEAKSMEVARKNK